MTHYRSPADEAKARAVRAMRAACDALYALRHLQPSDYPPPPDEHTTPRENWQFHRALVDDCLGLARIIGHYTTMVEDETHLLDQDEADEPAVVGETQPQASDPHAACVERWAGLLVLQDALSAALAGCSKGPDAGVHRLIAEYHTGPHSHPDEEVRGLYEECHAMLVNLRNWRSMMNSYLPRPILDSVEGLDVVVGPVEQSDD